jgi:hypothetical protein
MFFSLKKKVFLKILNKRSFYKISNVNLRNNYIKKDDLLKKILYTSYFKIFKYKKLKIDFNTKNLSFKPLEFQLYLYPFRYIFYADYQKDF